MLRFFVLGFLVVAGALTTLAAAVGGPAWWALVVVVVLLLVLAVHDLVQTRHSILRNYPVLGHLRFLMEDIRPELQQYFIERNFDGRPFDRDTRTSIYQRAKGQKDEAPFGTERDVYEIGYEYLVHSTAPRPKPDEPPRVRIGGPDCRHPYDMALLNVSAMSFGSLSGNAIEALNRGAAMGGFAHDTGEGAISPYHRQGGDLVWEVGSGYFGCRTKDGGFDEGEFADKAADDQVKMVSLKLSQGAKPGIGGVLPGAKVTEELARTRDVEQGKTVVSPPYHRVFSTPRELVRFIGHFRELAGGKPAGFKLCVGSRIDVLAICKAMLEEGVAPDFVIVDGAEGGTGAAPAEYQDHVGMPLTEGLMTVHNALVGTGLRDQVRIGASGKVATSADLVKRLVQGADYTNAARAMMMAVGCIQAQRCHTNTCPVGVATQDPKRQRALVVPDKAERVRSYQHLVVDGALQIMASMGVDSPSELHPGLLMRRTSASTTRSYAHLYDHLAPGELLAEAPESWAHDWAAADPDSFRPTGWALAPGRT
ncbi:FMN-binding glutamate synthase family protein [Nocardioides marmoribigeumensis]|uniref:Glutamate synthase domain-containing protein 2 n=1 Tax=Nocardioides marmoribigeumensis TaxID=433649 RepID=A0ABU2BW56_9ACTN|nr:FMN-binding glutamate synthase family protein [Nocardioides marmoribigeumensis]MDR7362868.1 glutamate synthase domain-containing protein 2 [Nocardioides marmoribigeumensis]